MIARRDVPRGGFGADPRVANLGFWILGIGPEHIERNLPMNGDGLDARHDTRAETSEHVDSREQLTRDTAARRKSGARRYNPPLMTVQFRFGWPAVAAAIGLVCVLPHSVGAQVLPTADVIVARHVEAIGGAEAYRAIQSVHARGRLEIPAQKIVAAFELFTARPAQMLYRVNVPGVGRIENGYDGTTGWSLNPISGPEVLAGRQLVEAAEDAWFDGPLHEPARIQQLTTIEQTTFDGRQAYKVRVLFRSGVEQMEYFDVETGLQIGSESSRATPQGVVPTTNVLRDYRKFGNLLQATTFIQRAMGFEQVVTLTSCDYDRVEPASFGLPPAVAALLPPAR